MHKGGLVELSFSIPLATARAGCFTGEYRSGGWRGAKCAGEEPDPR